MITSHSFPFRRRALVLALMLASGAAQATIINVSGDCSLVAAINNANTDTDTDGAGFGCRAGSGADNLSLTTNGLYTLTDVAQGNEDGLPWISSTITINGHGSTITRSGVYGTPYFRLIHVSAKGDLTLNSLTLTGGYLHPDSGGILNDGNMTLNNSIISGNSAFNTGAILNSGNMTLNNSIISGNSARITGAILNSGTMTLNHSSISGNQGYYNNGAIVNIGNMTLNHTNVSGNRVHFGGRNGAILNSGTMTLNHSTISGNGAHYIGAISNSGSMRLNDSIISGNKDVFATGGIFNSGIMTLSHSTVSRNESYGHYHDDTPYGSDDHFFGGNGGITNSGTMTLSNSTVSGNKGLSSGISNLGAMKLTNITLSGNITLAGNHSTAVAGAIANKGKLMLSHSTLSGNSAIGIKNYLGAEMTLTNSLIANSPVGGDCKNEGLLTLQGNNLIEDGSCRAPYGLR